MTNTKHCICRYVNNLYEGDVFDKFYEVLSKSKNEKKKQTIS